MVTATALYAYYPPKKPSALARNKEDSFFPSSLPFTFVPSHITCSTPSTSFHLVVHLLPQHERIPILNPEVVERSSIHH